MKHTTVEIPADIPVIHLCEIARSLGYTLQHVKHGHLRMIKREESLKPRGTAA